MKLSRMNSRCKLAVGLYVFVYSCIVLRLLLAFVPPLTCGCCRGNWEETDGARRYVPVAETMETEEVVELCREICRDIVPNCDMGMGPRPGPAATAVSTQRRRYKDKRKSRRGQ